MGAGTLREAMNNRRKLVIALGGGALTAPFGSFAQQARKIWRLGYLDFGSRQSMVNGGRLAALIEGLRERGYAEGTNCVIEARYADGDTDRLDGLAADLVRQNVDVIITFGTTATYAVKRATVTIPVILTAASDPVRDGFAVSLARPGGNMTGMSNGAADTVQKLVELLADAVPKLKRIAVIANSTSATHPQLIKNVESAARLIGKQVLAVPVQTPDEIERCFATMNRERIDAVIIFADPFLFQQRVQLARLALTRRLPSIYPQQQYAEAGGLMSYGSDVNDRFRRAGIFVDKILKGAKPGDIPFELPTRYYLVINRKTANALGVKITGELLTRADKVIG
jgi:putative ABC transport system substrate-binding protein